MGFCFALNLSCLLKFMKNVTDLRIDIQLLYYLHTFVLVE